MAFRAYNTLARHRSDRCTAAVQLTDPPSIHANRKRYDACDEQPTPTRATFAKRESQPKGIDNHHHTSGRPPAVAQREAEKSPAQMTMCAALESASASPLCRGVGAWKVMTGVLDIRMIRKLREREESGGIVRSGVSRY
jgi:hypothetical protein